MKTPTISNKIFWYHEDTAKESIFALNVQHEVLDWNHLPAYDLERGWVIDSGASAHTTPFIKDCRDVKILIERFS